MALWRKVLPMILVTTFILSSLLMTFLQLCLYFTIRRVSLHWYRKLNYYCIYSSWSQIVAIAEWWGNSSCCIYADDETWSKFCKEHSIVITNHKYEIDWAVAWMVCDKFGALGGAKSFAKSSLKKLPVIGWGWIFCEMIFLERNWERDSKLMPPALDAIMDYKDTTCLILFFAEGTRFTKEKHAASLQFAKERNLPQLKYHLLPRTKGFNLCAKHLKGKMDAVYNIQLAFEEDKAKPTASSLLWGRQVKGHMYLKRIPLADIPVDDDNLCSEWLYNLYKEKDGLMEGFEKNGYFPGKRHDVKRRIYPLLNLAGWALVMGLPIVYYLLKALLFGSSFVIAVASTIIAILAAGGYLMVRATKATKGSSYGMTVSPSKTPEKSESPPMGMEPILEENSS